MTHSASVPLIDWNALHILSDGDKTFESELLQLFVTDTRQHLSNLTEALSRQDIDQVRRLAHHLKGASANVGALSLSDVAATLENRARAQDLSPGPDLLQQMQTTFEAIAQLIELN